MQRLHLRRSGTGARTQTTQRRILRPRRRVRMRRAEPVHHLGIPVAQSPLARTMPTLRHRTTRTEPRRGCRHNDIRKGNAHYSTRGHMACRQRSNTQRRLPHQRTAPQGTRRTPRTASHHRQHTHGRHRRRRSTRHRHDVQRPDGVQSNRTGRTIRHTALGTQRVLRTHHGRCRSAGDHHHRTSTRRRHHTPQQGIRRTRSQRQGEHLRQRDAHRQTLLRQDALRIRRMQRGRDADERHHTLPCRRRTVPYLRRPIRQCGRQPGGLHRQPLSCQRRQPY